MDLRKIKLDLTIALMNNQNDALKAAEEVMLSIEEVGRFNGLQVISESDLDDEYKQQRYSMEFDNCVLNLDMVSNATLDYNIVNNFQLRQAV
jgi:hypothetical protein